MPEWIAVLIWVGLFGGLVWLAAYVGGNDPGSPG
jgi:hypothetical protein